MPAYIEVKDSKGQRQVSLDEGPVTIGRNFTNLLVLDETQASRFHCVIEKSPEGYSIRDLDSRNGFRVNGSPVRAAILYDGDVVSIGKTDMRLYLPNSKKNPSGGMGGGGRMIHSRNWRTWSAAQPPRASRANRPGRTSPMP